MRHTGIAELPLHGGKAPPWLFQRMVRLGREIVRLIVEDKGPEEVLRRISDPYWFQSLGGAWAVVQQGMNERFARRYHWHSENVESLTTDPHAAICSDLKLQRSLNLVTADSLPAQTVITELSREQPEKLMAELRQLQTLSLPSHHAIAVGDLHPESIEKILLKTYANQARDFQTLLGMPGVGAKTLRALTLIAELTYGTRASWKDPVKFSFAHGGKDGHPYRVNRTVYDQSIEILRHSLG